MEKELDGKKVKGKKEGERRYCKWEQEMDVGEDERSALWCDIRDPVGCVYVYVLSQERNSHRPTSQK